MSPMDLANKNARAGQETLEASGQVIARRLAIISEAVADPLRADHAELTLMGTEKVAAMGASAGALVEGAMDLTRASCQIAEREATHSAEMVQRLSQAQSLGDAARVQAQWGWDIWTRAMSDSQNLTRSLLDTQARALDPIHKAAVSNAKRLGR